MMSACVCARVLSAQGCGWSFTPFSPATHSHGLFFPTLETRQTARRLIEPIDETPSDIDLLQQDILNIIGRDSIITPDDLRGNASTLQEALIGTGKCVSRYAVLF